MTQNGPVTGLNKASVWTLKPGTKFLLLVGWVWFVLAIHIYAMLLLRWNTEFQVHMYPETGKNVKVGGGWQWT